MPFKSYGDTESLRYKKCLKAFLLPRRLYSSVADLRRAVLEVLDLLDAVKVNSCLGDA